MSSTLLFLCVLTLGTTQPTTAAVIAPATTQHVVTGTPPIQAFVTQAPEAKSSNGTIFWTVISGVIVFVLGQIILHMFIEPIQEQRKIVGEIANVTFYWANAWRRTDLTGEALTEHIKFLEDASDSVRKIASRLQASTSIIPMYGALEKCHCVVRRPTVRYVYNLLI